MSEPEVHIGDTGPGSRIEVIGVAAPEVHAGDDLVELVVASGDLRDGDVVALTSKVVSKSEGRFVPGPRADAVADQAVRILARRGESVIAETRHGLVLAAAGVDASNVAPGTALLLPLEPDSTARHVREGVQRRTGTNVAVVITDTAGRAWRNGQIDLAVGCAGLSALNDLSGTTDPYGNVLVVTAPAIADEIASAGDLVKGKTAGRPIAIVRGLGDTVLPPGDHGLGAAELVRPSEHDLFGLGAREAAVAAALRTDQVALAHFPPMFPVDPDPFGGVVSDRSDLRIEVSVTPAPGWLVCVLGRDDLGPDGLVHAGRLIERCAVLAAAHRLVEAADATAGTVEAAPVTDGRVDHGWRRIVGAHWIVAETMPSIDD